MLMPILSVKAPIPAAQGASAVEAAPSRERAPIVAIPGRISGTQSEAVLKILETLNRHLLGTEPLPKDALIRLLDTLAKILKFPPLPQETLRDFTKRLAVFLETLPPATRVALEKQLGQHNLAISIKILAEVLKMPSLSDMPRPLDRPVVMPAIPRAGSTLPEGRPLPAATVQQGQAQIVPGRPAPVNIPQMIVPNPAHIADPGLLQAALKKAFGGDDRASAIIAFEESIDGDSAATAVRTEQSPPKGQTASGNGTAATGGQPQQPAKANSDTIPLLRAAAAFLADDPEALSQVATITSGIDDQLKAELVEDLGLDFAESEEMSTQPERSSGAAGAQAQTEGDEFGTAQARPDTADRAVPPASSAAEGERTEADGVTVRDPGEREIDLQDPSIVSADEMPSSYSETEMDHTGKSLAQTLKALVEASLPLPGAAPDKTGTLFALMAGDTADMGAEILFAQLDAADIDGVLPDTSVLTGDTGDQTEPLALESEAWSAVLGGPEEKAAGRQVPLHSAAMDESAREAQAMRLPDAGLVRDAIPFAMIPYLPAKTQASRTVETEDEEQPAFSGQDSGDEGEHSEEQGEPEDQTGAAPQAITEDADDEAADAYDLYRRMGGYG
ncbi:hypothetical protein [Rhizobium sp. Root483D2]|uniref:hypothetical protein n=1 Tax=Rhizobium sp. Root483D2 TaxID=1736545 RepID=UPI0007123C04|nr:hypothetical protein [Rhizobium sp. Root483D2]KQY40569.1 hypothetical protein ASD32_02915 [Rhizobium sp. Root483D2]